jgi:[ribosomal protein S18]-alanine N-acetyltransferase
MSIVERHPTGSSVRLEPMKRKHVRDVLAIEREVYVRPWSAALFFSELSQRKTRHYIVALGSNEEIIGYAGLMVHDEEAHITNVAVSPANQSRRVGARMLLNIVHEARARGANRITLEVRVTNWPAQRLYSWFGFRPVGIRRNYYAETGEDALVMLLDEVRGDELGQRLDLIRSSLTFDNE